MNWPTATLDNRSRVRILAEAVPSAALEEVVVDAPYRQVWTWLADLEGSVAGFDPMVAKVKVLSRDGEHWRIKTWAPFLPLALDFDVRMEDGFCLMRGRWRVYLVMFAATPVDEHRTRITHVEAVPLPFTRWLRPVLRSFVRRDARGMARRFAR